eukprot:gb/GECG01013301.1/.p1 GENE.gb/GECG01013301.1/~~gb/GECG01013301.1/.p1  ORF type:complete len:141 (+),score=25.92 gb/GECG01013301.1/:1-423(+)
MCERKCIHRMTFAGSCFCTGNLMECSKAECAKKASELRQNRKGKSETSKKEDAPSKEENSNSTADATAAAAEAAKDLQIWTTDQQKALEEGLRLFPPTVNMSKSERWKEIASRVPGKSVKECVQRFKEIRQKLKADQSSS